MDRDLFDRFGDIEIRLSDREIHRVGKACAQIKDTSNARCVNVLDTLCDEAMGIKHGS